MNLITESQLAERFGLPPEKVAELRRKHSWPHTRFGRFDIRYTEAQVKEIVDRHGVRPIAQPVAPVNVTGQTARSAARGRSA